MYEKSESDEVVRTRIRGLVCDLRVENKMFGEPWDFNNQDKAMKAQGIVENKRALLLRHY